MKVFQLHPTLDCNRTCAWCPYLGEGDAEIPFTELQRQLLQERKSGCPILKVSGGGEATCYPYFKDILCYAYEIGYVVYLQTNGILLDSFMRQNIFDIRISYGDGIVFSPPDIRPNGFSYVVSANPEYGNLTEVIKYAQKHKIYIRVTPDDTDLENVPTIDEIKANLPTAFHPRMDFQLIKPGVSETDRLNSERLVRFWDALDFHSGKNPCPCYDSPLFTPFGWFPCCKTHVAKGVVPGYNRSMALGWEYPKTPYDGRGCTRCYY